MHNGSLMYCDWNDPESLVARITDVWPKRGQQDFHALLYDNNNKIIRLDRHHTLAGAVRQVEHLVV
jgi:hypothetical protein